MSGNPPARRPKPGVKARSAARLAAVQALYQIEVTGRPAVGVIKEFVAHRLGAELDEGEKLHDADQDFFGDLVRGATERRAEIDDLIAPALTADWPLDRLDSILRATLRIAVYEFLARVDVPAKVVINEYLDVAHAFFAGSEPAFANGVLNTLARRLRPAEFS
ncbi:transcription antitermination factor NusB [Zavarzinia compransoris]|uniref:Transcription antitermination protein NusB n=1 Tax=Zavarzinia compransoris TaxID=1264899 RepID=A0A317EED2_9PROT|nr:transcription antitermination factor NusB [Zavarzinia compransoris]PWR23713.1 transcription antitermination factor NusB [Zavarzinia compransoris]TDP47937.1 NusB antitermination factor [Zavarzinia compransoris]